MNKIKMKISDGGWFPSGCNTIPQNKQLCIIFLENNDNPIRICQYRDEIFYDVRDILWHDCVSEVFKIDRVRIWKPLGLPSDVNERILAEIEEWFEED